jgi:membrane fusion protein (multidrug efflux system)
MVAEAAITTKTPTSAIMVPATAVLHDGTVNGTTAVYVLDRDGARAHARRVTTGAARGDSLEIASGLEANDRVVVAGQQRLRDGALVKLLDANTTSNITARTKP